MTLVRQKWFIYVVCPYRLPQKYDIARDDDDNNWSLGGGGKCYITPPPKNIVFDKIKAFENVYMKYIWTSKVETLFHLTDVYNSWIKLTHRQRPNAKLN